MSNTFTVPAPLARSLRIGLYSELGEAGGDIERLDREARREEHPEWYERPLARLDAARALLDAIGWASPEPLREVDVDLSCHGTALLAALQREAAVHEDMVAEVDQVDAERARQGKGSKAHGTLARADALARLVANCEARLGAAELRGEQAS